MPFRDYLCWEGLCSVVLGLALAIVAFPGLGVEYERGWIGLLFVPAVLLALRGFAALRRGVPILAAGRWLTERPLREAESGIPSLPAAPLVRRLVIETGVWILAVGAWVLLARSSGLLVFGTGLASAAYGAVQALASRGRVRTVEGERASATPWRSGPGSGCPG